ncbi:MAG: hypothetical protein ABFC98_05795 [Candidatus Cloacimonas sp.]
MKIKIGRSNTGVMGFISWERLEEVFKSTDEIKEDEKLVGVDINENGITYTVETK